MVQQLIQQVTRWDTRLFGKVFGDVHHKTWKRFFRGLSVSAGSFSCALMGLAWALLQPSDIPYVVAGLTAFLMELTFYYVIKKNIRRPRPHQRLQGIQCLIAPPDEFSFPSGHTAAAFLMACLISTAFPLLIVPLFAWAFLVGFSRVYLGVHYPTDVLAGMFLGVASAQSALWMVRLLVG